MKEYLTNLNLTFKKLLVLMFFTLSSLVFGQNIVTYTFTNKSWGTTTTNWNSGADGYGFTNGKGILLLSPGTMAFGNSPINFTNISKVKVNYSTLSGSGTGSVRPYAVSGVEAVSQSGTAIAAAQAITTNGTTDLRTLTFTPVSSVSGFLQIYVSCSVARFYIRSVEITSATVFPPTASSQTLCSGSLVSELVASGTNLSWYTAATGGSALSASTLLSTATYYVSQTVSGIESDRTAAAITIGGTTTEWTGTSWTNGIPNSSSTAKISADYSGPGFSACTLEVTGTAVVTINSNETLDINGLVTVAPTASLVFNNNSTLLQTQNVSNVGAVQVKKESSPVIRLDYVGWSAPVANQNLAAFSPNTLTNRFYNYDPTGNTTATAWIPVDPLINDFTIAKGTLIRTPNTWSSSVYAPYQGIFNGVPNNGSYTPSVAVGFNLLGNPYPSALSADSFLSDNAALGANTLYFWAHVIPAVSGAYAQNNYASYTTAGGVAAAAGGSQPTGTIAIGQGFFTKALSAGTANFNNAQRTNTAATFFRTTSKASSALLERHRFWLDLTSPEVQHNQTMVAYMQGAENGIDAADGKLFENAASKVYSLVQNAAYAIQAKALPFNNLDIVPLGFVAANAGSFTIALSQTDGLFTAQDIYLKDNLLGTTHNLKTTSYIFNSEVGTFNQRFEVVYTPSTSLQTPTNAASENNLVVYKKENTIAIYWLHTPIAKVTIYDLQGRTLQTIENLNTTALQVENTGISNQVVLVKVESNEGKRSTKKLKL